MKNKKYNKFMETHKKRAIFKTGLTRSGLDVQYFLEINDKVAK